jgi:alginate O-acetyltransferase complex protein AlgI
MSFSGWLREYIYFPLGGSRDGRIGQYQNLIITMLVCGLWHGAAWGFIIWGGLHGIALVVHKQYSLWREARGGKPEQGGIGSRLSGWSLTLLFVCLTRIFFASPDLDSALAYFERLADFQAEGLGADRILLLGTALGLAWNFVGDRLLAGYERLSQPRPVWQQVAIFAAVLLLLTLIRPGAESPSAYFGF